MHVYKITNRVTGDFYIGQTSFVDVQKRFSRHKHNAKTQNLYLYKAMRKYGIENFEIEILESHAEPRLLLEAEIRLIAELNPRYNMTAGGTGGNTSESPNYKEGMKNRPVHESFLNSARMAGKQHTDDARQKQAIAREKYWQNVTAKDREARSVKLSGEKNGMFGKSPKNSLQISHNGVKYPSMAAASRATGLSTYHLKRSGAIIYHGS